eukprot:GFUD01112967.1.p1 GENE.GFUD01112967.1~~GFUD01112967.1.p1  ORF type:complete len:601 (+),score=193.90 GFUD01112967.1:82-1884(+)
MYSPPPMDGFSPPPMSDFSPPPMEDLSPLSDFPPPINGFSPPPVDGDDDTDDHFDFDISDTSYDLTGLSEKMNSLEFDKIKNLPPREILEMKKESSELNNFYSNNLKIETAEHMLVSENNNKHANGDVKVSVSSNEIHENGAFNDIDVELEVEHVDVNPLKSSLSDDVVFNSMESKGSDEQKDSVEDISCQISNSDVTNKVDESDPNTNDENIENQGIGTVDDEDLYNKPSEFEDSSESDPDSHLNLPEQPFPSFSEELKEGKDFPADEIWGEFPEEPANPAEKVPWGNFECETENSEWGDFGSTSSNLEITDDRTKPNKVRDIEFDDFSDDEFGDFGLADETNTKPNANPDQVPELSLMTQLERLDGVGENLINTVYGGRCKVWSSDGNASSELNLEDDVLGDSQVFQPMENPALTPALEYKWRDSATYSILLDTLGIDSRVVLDGENWRSSVPRYAPKTAATLLTPGLLTPEPVTSPGQEKPEEVSTEIKDAGNGLVTPAEFDWNNSGLTNPLEENGLSEVKATQQSTETSKVITELLVAQNNQTLSDKKNSSILQKHTSREAKNILDGFPLLNFMTSSVLMFPTKSIDKKKRRAKPD